MIWFLQVAAVLFAVLIIILAIQLIYGQGTTHGDLNQRLANLEEQALFQTCVLDIPPGEVTRGMIADCHLGDP